MGAFWQSFVEFGVLWIDGPVVAVGGSAVVMDVFVVSGVGR